MKFSMNKVITTIIFTAAVIIPLAGGAAPLPEKISCAIADKQAFQQPDRVHLTGWIGSRCSTICLPRNCRLAPAGTGWAVFTVMEGKKVYYNSNSTPDVTCCLSSGPRAVALIPSVAASIDADGVVMNLYDSGTANLTLRDGKPVLLTTETIYPSDGKIVITVDAESAAPFAFKARIPTWCCESTVKVNGKPVKVENGKDGYAAIKRSWVKGDKVELNFKLEPRVIAGEHSNIGKIAIMYGPLALVADEATLGKEGLPIGAISIGKPDLASLAIKQEPAPEKVKTWPHALVFHCNVIANEQPQEIRLMTFADAGSFDESYKIWLPLSRNVLTGGTESRSRKGDGVGSIIDENESSFTDMKIAHTYEEFPGGHTQDFWARSLPKHVEFFSKFLATGK